MSVSRVIEVSFGGGSIAYAKVDTAYFYNNGIFFKPTDIDLPASYQVHWADSPDKATTLETIGTAEGAPIPDDLWNRSRVIYGWIYLHPTNDSSITAYEVRIYKNVRAGLPDGTEPTPAEQSTIDQLIGALNSAVEQTDEDAESAEQAKDDAESARDNAQTYANNAQSSAQASARSAESASESARVASASATASAQSASQSAQIKAGVEDLVDDAQGYAESASQSASASAQSASASANSATTAQGYANSASASAQSASGYASSAQTSAQTASTKATEASTSAQTASQKATEASQSASQALSYKTDAESAKTASQTAQGKAEDAQTAAETAQGLAESARDSAIQAKDDAESAVASISGALADKAPIITDTALGAIASFSDGADDLPLKSLVVDINPIQDLHGQDAPYPAGGGKNKFDVDTWIALSRNNVYYSVTDEDVSVIANDVGGLLGRFIQLAPNTQYTISFKNATSGRVFDDTATTLVQFSNSQTSATFTTTESGQVAIKFYSTTYPHVVGKVQIELGSTATAWSPYENICPISGWTEVNVNHSDADMTNPTTITINLGQTVYGGKLDVLGGELTVDRAMVVFDGTENYQNAYFPTVVCTKNIGNSGDYSRRAEIFSNYCSAPNVGFVMSTATTIQWKYVDQNFGVSSADELKALFAQYYADGNPMTVVYPLATPITIQLTPNQVNSLLGVNNIWADSGDTEVEYRADTKLFIERLTAPDSADMVADANITSGQYFMVGNSLYKATANIANGSAIVVGTNCTRKSLSEALNEINA